MYLLRSRCLGWVEVIVCVQLVFVPLLCCCLYGSWILAEECVGEEENEQQEVPPCCCCLPKSFFYEKDQPKPGNVLRRTFRMSQVNQQPISMQELQNAASAEERSHLICCGRTISRERCCYPVDPLQANTTGRLGCLTEGSTTAGGAQPRTDSRNGSAVIMVDNTTYEADQSTVASESRNPTVDMDRQGP